MSCNPFLFVYSVCEVLANVFCYLINWLAITPSRIWSLSHLLTAALSCTVFPSSVYRRNLSACREVLKEVRGAVTEHQCTTHTRFLILSFSHNALPRNSTCCCPFFLVFIFTFLSTLIFLSFYPLPIISARSCMVMSKHTSQVCSLSFEANFMEQTPF